MKRALFFLPLLPLTVAGYFMLEDMVIKRRSAARIVMLGDERVKDFPEGKLPITFDGRDKETTTTLLTRLASVADEKPRKIVLEVGYNDLKAGISVDSLERNYIALIHLIKQHSPTTRIYLQDVLPGRQGDPANDAVSSFNRRLPAIAQAQGVIYLPIANILVPRGYLNPYLMDGQHFNDHAYFYWKKLIRRRMQE